MSTVYVSANTRVHSVTYVTDNVLVTLENIIRLSGLDPSKISDEWKVLHRGLKTWMESEHLTSVVLEVYNPSSGGLVGRWDIDIGYEWNDSDGNFWVDTDQIRAAIRKQGLWPSECKYCVIADTRPGAPDVQGWSSCSFRSTEGFVKQSLGATVQHCGLSGSASYYRRQN